MRALTRPLALAAAFVTAGELGAQEWRSLQSARQLHDTGAYEVRVRSTVGDQAVASDPVSVRAGPQGTEWFDAELRRPLLERVADETGGRYYSAATASALPDDVIYTTSGTTVRRQLELWDMPIAFLLLLGFVSAEWALRRALRTACRRRT